MKYLVFKQWDDTMISLCNPNSKPLALDDARALLKMYRATDKEHKYVLGMLSE